MTGVHHRVPATWRKLSDLATWWVILSLAAVGVGLLFWMGSASHAGESLATVMSIGLGSIAFVGVAAAVAVKVSRHP